MVGRGETVRIVHECSRHPSDGVVVRDRGALPVSVSAVRTNEAGSPISSTAAPTPATPSTSVPTPAFNVSPPPQAPGKERSVVREKCEEGDTESLDSFAAGSSALNEVGERGSVISGTVQQDGSQGNREGSIVQTVGHTSNDGNTNGASAPMDDSRMDSEELSHGAEASTTSALNCNVEESISMDADESHMSYAAAFSVSISSSFTAEAAVVMLPPPPPLPPTLDISSFLQEES